jgi:hypothetical protein
MNEQIKTYEEACERKGIDPVATLPDVTNVPEEFKKATVDHYKMMIVASVLNGDWKANWADYGQVKYWPWFDVVEDSTTSSGFRLSSGGYGGGYSRTGVGSRLCFKDVETAKYAGKQFADLYEGFMLINK